MDNSELYQISTKLYPKHLNADKKYYHTGIFILNCKYIHQWTKILVSKCHNITVPLCCVICSSKAWVRINQLYRNNDQHHCWVMHLGFCMWIFFQFCYSYCPWLSIHLQFSTCSCIAVGECWSESELMHLGVCLWIYSVFVNFLPFT
jgi:hypothetical protein